MMILYSGPTCPFSQMSRIILNEKGCDFQIESIDVDGFTENENTVDLAQLTPYGFVRCSASYLVNLRCITAVSRMNVYIGGAALPIGRTYKDAFTEAFSRYMAKKEWEDPCRS